LFAAWAFYSDAFTTVEEASTPTAAEAAATAASRRAETAIAAAAARQRETFVEAAATTRGAIEAAMVAEACAADASLRVALEAWREQQRRAAAAAAAAADAHRQAEADATASRAEMRATVDHLRGELDHLRAELDQERQRGWRLSDGATSIQREELRAALDRAEAAEAAAVYAHEEATSAQLELEAARRASSARVQTVRQREAEERRESAGLLLELRDELAAVHAEAAAAASPGSPAFAAASPSAAASQTTSGSSSGSATTSPSASASAAATYSSSSSGSASNSAMPG
jgi:hypothetical protein